MTPTHHPNCYFLSPVSFIFLYFAKFGAIMVTFYKYVILKLIHLAKNQICRCTVAILPFKSLSICHLNNPSIPPNKISSEYKVRYLRDRNYLSAILFCRLLTDFNINFLFHQRPTELTCALFLYLKKKVS